MDSQKYFDKLCTKQVGKTLVLLDEVGSTNRHAEKMIAKGERVNGTLILAKRQTAGRGRRQRVWESDGCLAMTVIIKSRRQLSEMPTINLLAGVAVSRAIRQITALDVCLKYPNDVMLSGKKVGGILSELKSGGRIIIGIGINLTQSSWQEPLANIAISLKQAGQNVMAEHMAAEVMNQLEPLLELFEQSGFSAIKPAWLEGNSTIGKQITAYTPSEKIDGTAIALADDGSLIIETAEGRKSVNSGDFSHKEN